MTRCGECGGLIPRARLLMVKGATHCVGCQAELERAETAAGRGPMERARLIAQNALAELGELDYSEQFRDRQGIA